MQDCAPFVTFIDSFFYLLPSLHEMTRCVESGVAGATDSFGWQPQSGRRVRVQCSTHAVCSCWCLQYLQ